MIDSMDIKQAKSWALCVIGSVSEGQIGVMQRERTEVTLRNNLSIFIFFNGTRLDQNFSKHIEPMSQNSYCNYMSIIFM